jgi:hypothetical protein
MSICPESPSGVPAFLPERPAFANVLVAEDPFISNFVRTVLQRQGHKVVTGEAGHATQLMKEGSITPDVVITNRPEAFLAFANNLRLIYIAANPDPELALPFLNSRVLRKPFRNEDLLAAVEQLTR